MRSISKQSAQVLNSFSSWADTCILYSTGRFVISYRKSIKLSDRIFVEGWLDEKFEEDVVVKPRARFFEGDYVIPDGEGEPPEASRIEEIIKGRVLFDFTLSKRSIEFSKKVSKGGKVLTVEHHPEKGESFNHEPIVVKNPDPKSLLPGKMQRLILGYATDSFPKNEEPLDIPIQLVKSLSAYRHDVSILDNGSAIVRPDGKPFTYYWAPFATVGGTS